MGSCDRDEREAARRAAIERFTRTVTAADGQLPLDEAALLIAACDHPPLDVIGQLARLDDIAGRCPSPTPEGIVRHLVHDVGLGGDVESYDAPENSFIDRVLDRGSGLPITLAVITIEVARRLGVHLVGVGMPGHFLVGVSSDDPLSTSRSTPERFIDMFRGGEFLDVEAARRLHRSFDPGADQWDEVWLRPVSSRLILIRMLNNLKGAYLRRRDLVGLEWVMHMRRAFPELAEVEAAEFARLMAGTN
jgi:regulator of sirC expression with transglutaminase-like and TPR domain